MPRHSDRKAAISWMTNHVKKIRKYAIMRELLDDDDSFEDDYLEIQERKLQRMKASRYLFRHRHYRKRTKFDVDDCILREGSQNFSDTEFLHSFRMTRESFHLLLHELKSKKAFSQSKFKKQCPVSFQLLVFLYRIGREGTGGSSASVSQFFRIGEGSVRNYVQRTIKALKEMKDEVIYWPNEKEREEMKSRLAPTGFRHCVGIIDGTLIVLEFRPEKYHECYYSRKCCYALNLMVVCDDNRRITFYYAGWPGSAHDNRVWRNSKLYLERKKYFSDLEYLLGDCAYSHSSVMVQAFKRHSATSQLPRNEHNFNTLLAQVRITSEHCIGVLKGRFACLKRNDIQLKKGKKELKELIDLITGCVILHNLMINYNEPDIPQEWYDQMRDDIDWSGYDEEEADIPNVEDDDAERREYVFNSIINNYFI
jgi:hypothetical protein